jgi:hypothetical protein
VQARRIDALSNLQKQEYERVNDKECSALLAEIASLKQRALKRMLLRLSLYSICP